MLFCKFKCCLLPHGSHYTSLLRLQQENLTKTEYRKNRPKSQLESQSRFICSSHLHWSCWNKTCFWFVYWPFSSKLESYSPRAFLQNTLHLLWKEQFRVFRCNARGVVIIYNARPSNEFICLCRRDFWMKSVFKRSSLKVHIKMFNFIQTNKKVPEIGYFYLIAINYELSLPDLTGWNQI